MFCRVQLRIIRIVKINCDINGKFVQLKVCKKILNLLNNVNENISEVKHLSKKLYTYIISRLKRIFMKHLFEVYAYNINFPKYIKNCIISKIFC